MVDAQRVQRFDVGRLDKFERVAGGGIRVPAFVARTGIQIYRDESGRELRELRHPDDVFAEESYRSFEHVPVTDLHPAELVDATNRRELSRGHACNVRPDGSRIAAELLITDAEMIRMVEARERVETSGGYTCVVVEEKGVYDGQPYDSRQRDIRGNHVGLGPEGWGRAGPEVGLRLDSGGHQIAPGRKLTARFDANEERPMRKHKLDGIDHDAGSDTHIQAVDRLLERKDADALAAKTKHDGVVAELQKQLDETKGRLDGVTAKATKLEGDLAEATKRADAAVAPAALDARVAERVELVSRARRVLGAKFDAAGKSDLEIMRATLDKRGVKLDSKATDGYVRGRFDSETEKAPDDETVSEEVGADGDDKDKPTKDGGSDRRDGGVRMTKSDGSADPETKLDAIEAENAKWAEKSDSRFAIRKRNRS